jgi:hypothetical protein
MEVITRHAVGHVLLKCSRYVTAVFAEECVPDIAETVFPGSAVDRDCPFTVLGHNGSQPAVGRIARYHILSKLSGQVSPLTTC